MGVWEGSTQHPPLPPTPKAITSFYVLTTASGKTLALSARHYVYLLASNPSNAEPVVLQARHARMGHSLLLADGSRSPIVAVTRERRAGLYNPHTLDGNIVVDGVLASCYATVEPAIAHPVMWPLRALYSVGINLMDATPEALRKAATSGIIDMLPAGK